MRNRRRGRKGTGVEVTGLFTDIESHSGERMIVFTLETDLDNSFR